MSKQRKGLIFSISGPSGVGKGTIINEVLKRIPTMVHSVSMTSRQPRQDEREGIEYYFRTHAEFEDLLANDEILEHDQYCGNYYGTPAAPIKELIEMGQDIILDITIPGTRKIIEQFPDATTIFLLPPSLQVLRQRLQIRGTETHEAIEKRIAKALVEIKEANTFEYLIINEDIEATVDKILAIYKAERCKYSRVAGIEYQIINIPKEEE